MDMLIPDITKYFWMFAIEILEYSTVKCDKPACVAVRRRIRK